MDPNHTLEQSQWDFFWVPRDVEVLDRAEVAAIRCRRELPHLNQVTRTRSTPERLPGLVRELTEFFGHRATRWMVPDTIERAPLERALAAAGWTALGHYEARVLSPDDYRARPAGGLDVRRVSTQSEMRDCHHVATRAFGWNHEASNDELAEQLAQCRDPGGRVHRFVVYAGDMPIGSGGFNWHPALGFAFLWAGGTLPEARGRGAYTSLLAARMRAAAQLGARWAGLYAKTDSSAPIVARQGFLKVGEMSYWAPRPS